MNRRIVLPLTVVGLVLCFSIIALPQTGCKTLGSGDFIRVLLPAAIMIAVTEPDFSVLFDAVMP